MSPLEVSLLFDSILLGVVLGVVLSWAWRLRGDLERVLEEIRKGV